MSNQFEPHDITILPTECYNCGHKLDADDYVCELCGVARGDKFYVCPKCNATFVDYADLTAPVLCYDCRPVQQPDTNPRKAQSDAQG